MNAEEEKNRLFEIISGHMRINGSEYCSTSEFESDIEDAAEEIYNELATLRAQLAEAREANERLAMRINWIRINHNDAVALRFALEATDKEIDGVKHLITERD